MSSHASIPREEHRVTGGPFEAADEHDLRFRMSRGCSCLDVENSPAALDDPAGDRDSLGSLSGMDRSTAANDGHASAWAPEKALWLQA
jgi:hypothetical protein